MDRLISINQYSDIPEKYRKTPISKLIEYHNLNKAFESYNTAQLLVGMCMDNRKHLHIPDNFSYIIRTGGANLRYSEFKVSYAIAVGGVKTLALIGHNNCGMVNLVARKDLFIENLKFRLNHNMYPLLMLPIDYMDYYSSSLSGLPEK